MDARFSQVFSRNKISGKYLDINHNLVRDLKNMDLWEDVKEKIIENRGDISKIDVIPEHIREVYKTSFTNSPYAYVEVAARAQKWFDQAISRNIYLETRDIDETMDLYTTAWEKGLKSTYYLHMKPRHNAEQSTTRVNKAETIGKRGFAAIATAPSSSQPASSGGFSRLVTTPKVEAPVVKPVALVEVIPEPTPVKSTVGFAQKVAVEAKPVTPTVPVAQEMALEPKSKFNIIVSDPGDDVVCDSCQ